MKDRLYLLAAPFMDGALGDQAWYCNDCAAMEGALLANPHWAERIEVLRQPFPRPRQELIDLIGEENQSMPVLVMDAKGAPPEAKRVGAHAILTSPKGIAFALVQRHGGAGPHP
jgi:hypothetical protein